MNRSKKLKFILLFALFFNYLINFPGAYALEESKTGQNKIFERYFINKLENNKLGHSHIKQTITKKENVSLIITDKYTQQEFKRFDVNVKITQQIQFVEDNEGNPLSFSLKEESLGESKTVEGRFKSADLLILTTKINGLEKQSSIKIDKTILFPYAIQNLYKNTTNDKFEYSTIEPSEGRIVTITAQRHGEERLREFSQEKFFNKYKLTFDMLPNIEDFEWRDKDGKLIKEVSSVFGIEQVATTKDEISKPNAQADIFIKNLIPIDQTFPKPWLLDNASYKIKFKDTPTNELFVSDNRQRILQVQNNAVYLKIKSQTRPKKEYDYPLNNSGYQKYLLPGIYINSDDKAIKKQALNISNNHSKAYDLAKAMEKWTYDNITRKNLKVAFANASQVMQQREGDCTEHSLLLASLLRAAGIPCKIVIGLVYTEKPEKAFGYHMWVSAYIGEWINLDPSFPDQNFNPTHIALAESSFNKLNDKTDTLLKILRFINNINIEILDYSKTSDQVMDIDVANPNQHQQVKTFNLSEMENSNSTPIKVIKLDKEAPADFNSQILNIKTKDKSRDEVINQAFVDFVSGKIEASRNKFNAVADEIDYYDDYSKFKLASKAASLGFFNIALKCLDGISEREVWLYQSANLKFTLFPKETPNHDSEGVLSEAISLLDYQNKPEESYNLLINNKVKLKTNDFYYYLLAKALRKLYKYEEAEANIKYAKKLNNNNVMYWLEEADLYIENKDYSEADELLGKLATIKIYDNNIKQLINDKYYKNGFELHKKDRNKSQIYLAKFYMNKKEYSNALIILKKIEISNGKNSEFYQLLGKSYSELGDSANAIKSYNKAVMYDDKNIDALMGLGDEVLNANSPNLKKAYNYYVKAYKYDTEQSGSAEKLAYILKLQNQKDLSYKYYLSILRKDPRSFDANYNIALFHYIAKNYDEAIEYFKTALSVNPLSIDIWTYLAKIEIQKKNYYLAKTYLEPIQYIDDENPVYFYLLGLIHKLNENYSTARKNFRKALEINPDYDKAILELNELK